MLDTNPIPTTTATNTQDTKRKEWLIESTTISKRCINQIREIVENLNLQPNPDKPVIALSIGDPTVYGNLPPPEEAVQAIVDAATSAAWNGYGPAIGHEASRQAVADYLNRSGARFAAQDIILCNGCSSAIEFCITALAEPHRHNLLIPRPNFPLYKTLCHSTSIETRCYNLLPENGWQIDLAHLESQIDPNTVAILINNPSNPCGSVYNSEHLRMILDVAERKHVPIIADEIYGDLVFEGATFTSFATLAHNVPVLICGGIAKQFLLPGWRLGWVAVHDEIGAFEQVRQGLNRLSTRILGACTLVQAALPKLLSDTPREFRQNLIKQLETNAQIVLKTLDNVKGLTVYKSQGTMYMILEIELNRFQQFDNSLDFSKKLMEEESVFCLPGDCFDIPGFLRIVITVPDELLQEACERIKQFCNRYYT